MKLEFTLKRRRKQNGNLYYGTVRLKSLRKHWGWGL
jgi:hypothetical protein